MSRPLKFTTDSNNSMRKSVSHGDTLPHTVVGVSLWWISADGTFSPTRNLITMRCSTLRGTFCSLITLATPWQDWTSSNPSRREGGGCGFTLSRSHSCCAVRLVYIQISPGHIWITLYNLTDEIITVLNNKLILGGGRILWLREGVRLWKSWEKISDYLRVPAQFHYRNALIAAEKWNIAANTRNWKPIPRSSIKYYIFYVYEFRMWIRE